jgi:hypothetical protein
MHALASTAGRLEGIALRAGRLADGELLSQCGARTWSGSRGRTLADIVDREAAVFTLHGDGPAGARSLEPLTSRAQEVLDAPESARRLDVLRASIDDLGDAPNLERLTLTATDDATEAVGLLADTRFHDRFGDPLRRFPHAGQLDRVFKHAAGLSNMAGRHTGETGEVILPPIVAGRVLDPSFASPTTRIAHLVTPQKSFEVPAHELLHARQAIGASRDPIWVGTREATASIVGRLRSARLAEDLGSPLQKLTADDYRNVYNPWLQLYTGLARLGGRALDDPTDIAAMEQQFARLDPQQLFAEMTSAAAQRIGAPVEDVRRGMTEALVAKRPEPLVAVLEGASLPKPDFSLEWIYAEARRRGGLPAIASS